jgi:hypothetical protein
MTGARNWRCRWIGKNQFHVDFGPIHVHVFTRVPTQITFHFTLVMPAVTYQSPQNLRDSSRNLPDKAIRRLKVVASDGNFYNINGERSEPSSIFEHFGRREKVTRPCGLTTHAVITPSGQFLPRSRSCHALSAAAQITPFVTRVIDLHAHTCACTCTPRGGGLT